MMYRQPCRQIDKLTKNHNNKKEIFFYKYKWVPMFGLPSSKKYCVQKFE